MWKPVLVAVAVVVVGFLAATRGADLWYASQDRPTRGELHVPAVIQAPPRSAPTVEDRGPVGPVAAAMAVNEVVDGLSGEIEHPWVAVSGLDGSYRALDEPDLPAAGAGLMRVSPDGRMLAWAAEDRVVLYDPVADRARRVPLSSRARVGDFSPDGSRLLVHDGSLRAMDVATGELGRRVSASASAVGRAAWTPDGTAATFVDDRELVTASVLGGPSFQQGTDLPLTTTFAWSPTGDRLVSLDSSGGELRLWKRGEDGMLAPERVVRGTGVYVDRLVGYTDDDRLAVLALSLDTGALPRLFEVGVGRAGEEARDIAVLPQGADNWAGEQTVAWATGAVAAGSAHFARPRWPWPDSAILMSLGVLVGFGLGMYLTRRRVRRRWLRWVGRLRVRRTRHA